MSTSQNKDARVEASRVTKVETTYERVPIFGAILGYWRKLDLRRMGESFELYISTPLNEYDRLIINGEEIPIPRKDDL